jgi:tRNA modification GTPase
MSNNPSKKNSETIAAVATPLGKGGIHVVRLSGLDTRAIADRVFDGSVALSSAASHTAHYGKITDPESGVHLDDVIAVTMWEPRSYTREDTVEFSTHGSPFISTQLVELLVRCGARLAEPGEFTLRAFLNGRIDLSQAEAVADLISADTQLSHRVAMSQLEGRVSEHVNTLRDNLLQSLALIEAYTDFPEENIARSHFDQIESSMATACEEIESLIESFECGRILKDGLVVAIVGPPNAGKSSLFNYLLDHERTIVASRPGTTRDSVSETVSIDGLMVELIDTAGIHDTSDPIDRAAVERSRSEIVGADVLIGIVDGLSDNVDEQLREISTLAPGKTTIRVLNKIDVMDDDKIEAIRSLLPDDVQYISAVSGEGTDALKRALIRHAFPGGKLSDKGEVRISSVRHRDALSRSRSQLRSAIDTLREGRGPELVAFELRLAADQLGLIVGKLTPDEILNQIFSRFCIGK